MDVCEWLYNVRKLDQLIEAKNEERKRLIAIATDISPRMPDGMPISNTGTVSQKMANAVCTLVDMEREMEKLIEHYTSSKQKIVDAIEKLPEKEYGVIHRYYIRHMTYEQIAEEMNCSTVTVWRIKKKAMKNLKENFKCN